MNLGSQELLARLRREFDSSFAAAPAEADFGDRVDLLAIRAGGHDLAVRVDEAASIQKCPALVVLPGCQAALAGLAGVRGNVVAVYDVASLFVGGRSSVGGGGWIVVCAADRSAALRFDRLDGYERVAADAVGSSGVTPPEAPVDGVVRLRGVHRSLLSIARTVEDLKRHARLGGVTVATKRQSTEPD